MRTIYVAAFFRTKQRCAYGNYVTYEGDAIAREAYGSNYERLAALKRTVDAEPRPSDYFYAGGPNSWQL